MEKINNNIKDKKEMILNVEEVKKQMNALKLKDRIALAWKLVLGGL